ncbi:glycosyltransferase [Niabella aurantiaca]|uniref:glycosyltransferase n=1 Tax=Niabella aurantiaca TaxID=379900 RepID=UPI0003630E62|nr:glycosyltransferase [Niabella aurantiaca]
MPDLTPGYIIFIALLFFTAVLLFYYFFFFARLVFFRARPRKSTQQHPVSIVVCGKDEARNLAKNIPGLIFQEYTASRQILVVNDNSVDDSKYILQELNARYGGLTVLNLQQNAQHIPGKKYPLSMGIREAAHEILLLTDADCVPATEFWLQKMQEPYEEGIDIVLGYGAYHKLPGFLNKVIRYETFHSALQYLSYALAGHPYMGVGRNLSYKKNIFLKNKGFSGLNHLPGGDDDLFINKVANGKNTAIVIDPEAHTLSSPKRTWKDWRYQKTRHFSTSKYYKPKHQILLGLYSLSHFLFYFLILSCCIWYNWRIGLGILAGKSIIQQLVFARAMKRLNEADLRKWVLVMDLWMVFYYLLFTPALIKKEKKTWN